MYKIFRISQNILPKIGKPFEIFKKRFEFFVDLKTCKLFLF